MPNTSQMILDTLQQHQKPMSIQQITQATQQSRSKVQQALARLAKPNTQRNARVKRTDTGVYQILKENEAPPQDEEKKPSIQQTIFKCFTEMNKILTTQDIQNATDFTKNQINDATHRLSKPNKKRDALIQRVDTGTYKLIQNKKQKEDTPTEKTTPEPENEPTQQPIATPPHPLQHPQDVPTYIPPDTVSIEQFNTVQHNTNRLWLLHKSIKQALRTLDTYGETIPLPQLFMDANEAKKYAEALKTYLVSSILYEQAIQAVEKNPLKPLPNQYEQQEQHTEITQHNTEQEKNEHKNFTFAGEHFDSIQDLRHTLEEIKIKSPLNKPITGTDQTILYQLLRYAQNYKNIVRRGIHHFQVQLQDRKNPQSRTFALIHSDSTLTKIPIQECIKRYTDGEIPEPENQN